MARVFFVIFFSISNGLMHHVSSLISTKTGLAPTYFIALAHETHVVSGNIISSPFLYLKPLMRDVMLSAAEVADVYFKLFFFGSSKFLILPKHLSQPLITALDTFFDLASI